MRSEWLVAPALVLGSVLLTLLAGELVLRFTRPPMAGGGARIPVERTCGDCGYLYELNPEHPRISEQGTRDRLYAIPKPRGTFRILLLGDSVAFGAGVERAQLFSEVLERSLDRPGRRVEVVNTAVRGYSTYNELHYFIERGRLFQPDLVLAAFCMNDVIDPLLHWNRGNHRIVEVPRDAIPNPEYHDREIRPLFRYRKWKGVASQHSALFRRFARTLLPRIDRALGWEPSAPVEATRSSSGALPTYLTLEYEVGIEVLLDESTPEWRWLRGQYDRLQDAVTRSGARLVVLVFPLAYQRDPDYPHLPQILWRRYCASRGLACLDLLEALRSGLEDEHFESDEDWYDDVWMDTWHLTPKGHAIVAAATQRFLEQEELVPARRPR